MNNGSQIFQDEHGLRVRYCDPCISKITKNQKSDIRAFLSNNTQKEILKMSLIFTTSYKFSLLHLVKYFSCQRRFVCCQHWSHFNRPFLQPLIEGTTKPQLYYRSSRFLFCHFVKSRFHTEYKALPFLRKNEQTGFVFPQP